MQPSSAKKGRYTYSVTASDLQKEQAAFAAGEGVRNMYIMPV